MENNDLTAGFRVAWSPSLPVSQVEFAEFTFLPKYMGTGAQPHRLEPTRGVVAAMMSTGEVKVFVRDTAPCSVAPPQEVVKAWLAAASAIAPEGLVPDLQGAAAAGASLYGRIAYKAAKIKRAVEGQPPPRLHHPAKSGVTADGVPWEVYPAYAWHYDRAEGNLEGMAELVLGGFPLLVQDETGDGTMATCLSLVSDAPMPSDTTSALYSAVSGIADLRAARDRAALQGNGYDPVPLQRVDLLGSLITVRTADGGWTCSRITHSLVEMLWNDPAKKGRPWWGELANLRSDNWTPVRDAIKALVSRIP
jgi:hypothetical protein